MDNSNGWGMTARIHAAARSALGLCLAAAVGLAASGCGDSESAADAVFSATHDQTTATLAVGDVFELQLSENGSTGYSWEFVLSSEGVIQLVSSDYEQMGDEQGSGGLRVTTYECLAAGEVRLAGYYVRSWEQEELPEETDFALTVIVR